MRGIKSIIVILASLFVSINSISAQSLPDEFKNAIYRMNIFFPDTNIVTVGTAVNFVDSIIGRFFITCKHLIYKDSTYADSARFYRNEYFPNGTIYSGDNYFSVRISPDSAINTIIFPGSIDLAMVLPQERHTSSNPPGLYFQSLKSRIIVDKKTLENIIDVGDRVEIIGFEFQQPPGRQYYFSRFGHVSLYSPENISRRIDDKIIKANLIILDISSRGGDSGGPVILFKDDNKSYFIGINSASNLYNEYGIVYPAHYIRDLIDIFHAILQR